jgi:hypothetical protein
MGSARNGRESYAQGLYQFSVMSHSLSTIALVVVVILVVDLSVVAGAGSCCYCHTNLIAYRRSEEGIKRDALLSAQASVGLGKCQCQCQAEATGPHCPT